MFQKTIFIAVFVMLQHVAFAEQSPVSLWSTANCGVLIQSGETRILVDGLFRPHPEWEGFSFSSLDSVQLSSARQKDGQLADIDLILSTHVHRDHFHPDEVASYLRGNQDAVFVGNAQLVESVLESDVNSPQLSDRLIQPQTSDGISNYQVPGVELTFVPIIHAGAPYGWIDNDAILIELEGLRILHLGDAKPDPGLFTYFKDIPQTIDLVIAPFWFLLQAPQSEKAGMQIVTEILAAKRVMAVHLPPDPVRVARYSQMLRDAYPKIIVATDLFQKIDW